jgi:hypothetical protein
MRLEADTDLYADMKMAVFGNIATCSLVHTDRRIRAVAILILTVVKTLNLTCAKDARVKLCVRFTMYDVIKKYGLVDVLLYLGTVRILAVAFTFRPRAVSNVGPKSRSGRDGEEKDFFWQLNARRPARS